MLVSCKALDLSKETEKVKEEKKTSSVEYASKEVVTYAAENDGYVVPMLCHLECRKADFSKYPMVFGERELCDKDLLIETIENAIKLHVEKLKAR